MSLAADESLFSPQTLIAPPRSNAGYEALPEAVKAVYSEAEWLWLSARGKNELMQRETEPETE